jgi:acyl carrier protein
MPIEKKLIPLAAAAIAAAGVNAQTPQIEGQSSGEKEQTKEWTRDEIRENVWGIVSKISGVPVSQINPEDDFTNKLGMDSLDYVEVILDIEHRFGIRMPDELLGKIMKVGPLEEWVKGKVMGEEE